MGEALIAGTEKGTEMAQTVSVESTGDAMSIYEAQPEGTPRGAVIVIQEAFGVNEHIEDVTRRLAKERYLAVAPHLFHRSGDGTIAYDDMANVMPHMMALSREGLESDVDATIAHLENKGFALDQIGIVGFCMGGSVAFLAAVRQALGGAVTFYGGGISEGRFGLAPLVDLAPELKTPWLGLYGDRDQSISGEQVEALREAVKAAPVESEIARYPDAEHGFHCDARDSYHEASAKEAWQRTLRWFESHLAAP